MFIAGDMLWYPVARNTSIRQAPDVMVVFGRPKGDRGSYIQTQEEDIAPQVVFEILSPGNTKRDGRVDEIDALAVTRNWRKQSDVTWANGDFSGDGHIDDSDAAILAQHWMMTVEDSEDDNTRDEVFAEIGVMDDAFLLLDG